MNILSVATTSSCSPSNPREKALRTNVERRRHLKHSVQFHCERAMTHCQPSSTKPLSASCNVLWDHIEELSNALHKVEERIEQDDQKQLLAQHWYYDDEELADLMYDI
jgi:hypothetical protein